MRLKKRIKRGLTKAKKAAGQVFEKAKDVGVIAVLVPFKGLMQRTLRKIGVKPKNNLTDLAKQFFQYVVRRNSYDETKHLTTGTGLSIDTEFEQFHGIDVTRDSIDPVTLSVIVTAIVKYVKGVQDKKERDEPLTPTQKTVATVGDEVNRRYGELKDEAVSMEVGEVVKQYWWVAAIGLIFLLKK